jgi:hypothetical protein
MLLLRPPSYLQSLPHHMCLLPRIGLVQATLPWSCVSLRLALAGALLFGGDILVLWCFWLLLLEVLDAGIPNF